MTDPLKNKGIPWYWQVLIWLGVAGVLGLIVWKMGSNIIAFFNTITKGLSDAAKDVESSTQGQDDTTVEGFKKGNWQALMADQQNNPFQQSMPGYDATIETQPEMLQTDKKNFTDAIAITGAKSLSPIWIVSADTVLSAIQALGRKSIINWVYRQVKTDGTDLITYLGGSTDPTTLDAIASAIYNMPL